MTPLIPEAKLYNEFLGFMHNDTLGNKNLYTEFSREEIKAWLIEHGFTVPS